MGGDLKGLADWESKVDLFNKWPLSEMEVGRIKNKKNGDIKLYNGRLRKFDGIKWGC